MRTTRSGESALLLLDVIDALATGGVDYAVIGALAASVHGTVRASLDADAALLRVSDRHENRVDLLLGLRGMEPGAFSRVVAVPFQGAALKFIGREDFIAMKAFAGGPVDLLDAASALDAADQSLDVELLRRIAKSYGREAAATVEALLA